MNRRTIDHRPPARPTSAEAATPRGWLQLLGRLAAWPAALALMVLAGAGCGLILDLSPPDVQGSIYQCGITVRSADGLVRTLSTADPDLLGRLFYSCSSASTACPAACTGVEVSDQFNRYVAQRIGEISAAPLGDDPSDFRLYSGPWCVVGQEPCEAVMRLSGSVAPACPPPPTAGPLPLCPPPPASPEMCLQAMPASLDFPEIGSGTASAPMAVQVENCGNTPCPIRVSDALLGDADHFTVRLNDCAPTAADLFLMRDRTLVPAASDPAGAVCGVEVLYTPRTRGRHRATLVVASDCAPEQRIELGGNALGGSVNVNPNPVCVVTPPAGACTAPQAVRIENLGPGVLQVTNPAVFSRGAPNFEVVSGPPVPFDIPPGGSATVLIRWCDLPTSGERDGVLDITTDDPASPTVMVRVTLAASCP
jgi:hypothetical protein